MWYGPDVRTNRYVRASRPPMEVPVMQDRPHQRRIVAWCTMSYNICIGSGFSTTACVILCCVPAGLEVHWTVCPVPVSLDLLLWTDRFPILPSLTCVESTPIWTLTQNQPAECVGPFIPAVGWLAAGDVTWTLLCTESLFAPGQDTRPSQVDNHSCLLTLWNNLELLIRHICVFWVCPKKTNINTERGHTERLQPNKKALEQNPCILRWPCCSAAATSLEMPAQRIPQARVAQRPIILVVI